MQTKPTETYEELNARLRDEPESVEITEKAKWARLQMNMTKEQEDELLDDPKPAQGYAQTKITMPVKSGEKLAEAELPRGNAA